MQNLNVNNGLRNAEQVCLGWNYMINSFNAGFVFKIALTFNIANFNQMVNNI